MMTQTSMTQTSMTQTSVLVRSVARGASPPSSPRRSPARRSPAPRPPAAELSPRQRLTAKGPESLSDAELVSVLLRDGISHDAARLLDELGGFVGFSSHDVRSLRRLGLTPTQATTLVSALELGRRVIRDELPRRRLCDHPRAIARYIAARYRCPDRQTVGALFLGLDDRLRSEAEIFQGTLTATKVELRPILRRALVASAGYVVVFQTRPCGDVEPTAGDWAFTHRLVAAGELLGIGIRDHLIVANADRWTSLVRRRPW